MRYNFARMQYWARVVELSESYNAASDSVAGYEAGAMHQYTITEPFTAVEATAPLAEVHGRDRPE